jgi:acylphosphatase
MHRLLARAVAGVAAALALPAAALGKGHGGHGKGAEHGKGADHGKGQQHTRALNLKGTVAAVGDGTIDVLVKGANHHGRALRGQTITVDVSNARIVVRDVNGDGQRDLADVAAGDRVLVQSRIAKGEVPDPAQPLVAKRVVDKGQKKADDGSGDETGDDSSTGDDGSAGDDTGSDTP